MAKHGVVRRSPEAGVAAFAMTPTRFMSALVFSVPQQRETS
jgi:hypothetical protein